MLGHEDILKDEEFCGYKISVDFQVITFGVIKDLNAYIGVPVVANCFTLISARF